MKILFISLFLFVTYNSFSQSKNDNTIIIKDTTITLDNVMKSFIKEGYPVEIHEKSYIVTGLVSKSKLAYSQKLSALKEGDSILIKGWFKVGVELFGLKNELEIITNKGQKGSIYKSSFDSMNKLAMSLSNKITYAKQ